MQREEKSERSRRLVLDAGLRLFSKNGYGATSVREIATAAGVSIGNLYHHFPDKETIFRTLLDEYRALTSSDAFPLARAMRSGTFPDNIEEIAFAARESVRQYRHYYALIFVDVIEFEGSHIRGFYADMASRYQEFVTAQREQGETYPTLRPGVPAGAAMQMVVRFFVNYFQLEILFGVPEPFGGQSGDIVRQISDMLRQGIGKK